MAAFFLQRREFRQRVAGLGRFRPSRLRGSVCGVRNVEFERFAAWRSQGLFGKVDGELIAFVGFNFFEKLVNLFFCQNDRQKAVFVAVG